MDGTKKCVLRPLECLFKSSAVLLVNGQNLWSLVWEKIWNDGVYRVCTDGAANALKDRVKYRNAQLPHLLCGDFDSVTQKAFNFFKQSGILVKATPDQDYTDMCKALRIMANEINQKHYNAERLVVLGGLSGRIDHTLSSFNSLLRFRSISDCPIFIIDNVNLVTLVTEGTTEIQLDNYQSCITGIAGFVPFCQRPTIVTSEGFKWNLTDTPMEFGGCISTSNQIKRDIVTLTTTAPLIFTLELSSDFLG